MGWRSRFVDYAHSAMWLQQCPHGPSQKECKDLQDQLVFGHCVQEAIEKISGAVPRMVLETESRFSQRRSRVVSLTIHHAPLDVALRLSCELLGSLREVAMTDFGHWVLREIFENERMPMELILQFAEELCPHVVELSQHKNGTCVVQRLVGRLLDLGRAFGGSVSRNVTQQVLPRLLEFCYHESAHHVVETFLKKGDRPHQHEVVLGLLSQGYNIASDRYGSFVLKAAFECCCPEDQQLLVSAFSNDELVC